LPAGNGTHTHIYTHTHTDDEDESETAAETENWWEKQPGGRLAYDIAKLCGKQIEFEVAGWGGATDIVRKWLDAGWQSEAILNSIKAQLAAKRDGPPHGVSYFEKGITKHISVLKRPLPTIVEIPAKSVEVTHAKATRPREPWQVRRDEHYEALAELDASIEADKRAAAERAANSGEGGGVEIIPPAAEIRRR
jgi:hypothetical protein